MNKLLVALIAGLFAASAFAQGAVPAAPAASASAAVKADAKEKKADIKADAKETKLGNTNSEASRRGPNPVKSRLFWVWIGAAAGVLIVTFSLFWHVGRWTHVEAQGVPSSP